MMLKGIAYGKSTVLATISATFSPTGRYVTCNEEYGMVNSWSKMETREGLLIHSISNNFIKSLNDVPLKIVSSEVFYRGRCCEEDQIIASSFQMGPPPKFLAVSNRYASQGEAVLYLSDSENGVKRELEGRPGKMFIQKFKFNYSDLKVADFSLYDSSSFLNAVMWHCELSGSEGYSSIVFSQTLAEMIRNKFDGMLVNGVRGNDKIRYKNLVIFNPTDKWESWIYDDVYNV